MCFLGFNIGLPRFRNSVSIMYKAANQLANAGNRRLDDCVYRQGLGSSVVIDERSRFINLTIFKEMFRNVIGLDSMLSMSQYRFRASGRLAR